MNRLLSHIVLLCLLPLVITGCGSSRKSVRSGGSGRVTSTASAGKGSGSPSAAVALSDGGSAYLAELLAGISDPMARDLISEAGQWIGTRYVYGGASRTGTDCSGLVMSVYRDVCGLKIPRTTRDQVRYCTQVARNKLQPGDLIFFGKGESTDSVSHVGMYVGEGRMIHASSSRGVIVSPFETGYWAERYCTGARVEAAPKAYASLGKTPAPVPSLPPAIVPSLPPAIEYEPMASATPPPTPAETFPINENLSIASAGAFSIDMLDEIISAKIDSITTSSTFLPF